MAPVDFYYVGFSPPCRAVMLTAKALNVPLNKILLNLLKGDQKKPEFLAINPQHCVPTIVDGTFKLWESRAIQSYLVGKFGKNDKLYPNEVEQRATVDWLLYFDASTLFTRMAKYLSDLIFDRGPLDPEKLASFLEAVGWLDTYIGDKKFTACDHITIADHAIIGTMTQVEVLNIDFSKYKNVVAWMKRCRSEMPGYQTECQAGVDQLKEFLAPKLAKSSS